MSEAASEDARTLEDYASFLRFLGEEALPYAVIGGCAVGAYGRLRGLRVTSRDLDIFAAPAAINDLLLKLPGIGVRIRNRPRPRNIPVAMFEWEGKEVNVLSSSNGLPDPSAVAAHAREFRLSEAGGLAVPVADPFDLLSNKLAVNRPKDRPHMGVLKAFLEEEIVEAFEKEAEPRPRFLPAQRYLDVTGAERLAEPLFTRLLSLAKLPTDFRFLAARAPTRALLQQLVSRAPEELALEIAGIADRRRPLLLPRRAAR